MKRIIRHPQTHRYLTQDGQWTDDLSLAQSFLRVIDASAAKDKHNLGVVELFYPFNDDARTDLDMAVPLL